MAEPDSKFIREMIARTVDERVNGLEKGGGGGHDGGMDDVLRRVAALEGDVKEVKAGLKALVDEVHSNGVDLAEIKGRLANMPSTFQMLTWFVGVSIAMVGLTFTIARLMGSH
jgi:hypothetical protein